MTLKRILIIILVIALPPILIWLYLPGWSHYNELRKEDERLQKELTDLRKTNQHLTDQERLLKSDVRYLEKVLREELNVVRPDETVYKLVPETADGTVEAPVEPPKEPQTVTPEPKATSATNKATSKKKTHR